MATKEKMARDNARDKYFNIIKGLLEGVGEDALVVATNKIAFPIVDENGNEQTIMVTVSVPTGARGGEGYDPYAEADAYKVEKASKEAKAKEKAQAKAKKIERVK